MNECHYTIVDEDGEWQPCNKPAVGVRASLDDGDTFPVCRDHLCGGCGSYHDDCTPIPAPPERRILTDLIAELRDRHGPTHLGGACHCGSFAWPCVELRPLDRAEERLREATTGGTAPESVP